MTRSLLILLTLPFTFLSSKGQTSSSQIAEVDPAALYQLHCAACHGKNMEGAQYSPLIKENWTYGIDRKRMYNTIMYGITGTDMIPWSNVLRAEQINALTDYIMASQDRPPETGNPAPTNRDAGLCCEGGIDRNRRIWNEPLGD